MTTTANSSPSQTRSSSSEDCWSCRLISGSGLGVAGLYVINSGRKQRTKSAGWIVSSLGAGLCVLGICRVFSLPPFSHLKFKTSAAYPHGSVSGKRQ